MLIAILMSLNIVSVGYATWAITGPSTSEAGGSFQSYAVAYYTIAIDPSFQAYHNKNNVGFFIPKGDLGSLKSPTEQGALMSNAPANQATLTLEYTQMSTQATTVTTTVMFSPDATISAKFFATAEPTSVQLNESNIDFNCSNGVLSFTFQPKTGDKVVITFSTNGNPQFDSALCTGEKRDFVVRTMVQDTN